MNSRRILCVDDEERVLQGLRNVLDWSFELSTAQSGAEALRVLRAARADDKPFAVVVSDMRMPEMDGAELLSRVREEFPEATRLLLTGYTDIDSAMKAVNEGGIYRLLLKPCPPEVLERTAEEALEQYRLVRAERELLDETLQGAIEALVETLSLASPIAFSRATVIRDYVRWMARDEPDETRWIYTTAAMFVHMGLVAVPHDVIERFVAQRELSEHERDMVERSGDIASTLVGHVPRLEPVAAVLRGLRATTPIDDDVIARGVELLRVAVDLDLAVMRGATVPEALRPLAKKHAPEVVESLSGFRPAHHDNEVRAVDIAQLDTSMTLAEDIHLANGQLLVRKDQAITPALMSRIDNFDRSVGVKQPILVRVSRH